MTSRLLVCLMLLMAAACSPATVPLAYDAPPERVLKPCCEHPERYPRAYISLVEAMAPLVAPGIGNRVDRPGAFANDPDAQAFITRQLRPLDLVMVRNMGRKSGQIIPGHFTHVAVWLGNARTLKAAGLWSDPAILPHRDEILAGHTFIESQIDGVHLSPASDILNTDAVAVLRPALSATERRFATRELFSELGRPFDVHFDLRDPELIFCSEMVARAMPGLELPVRMVYGRPSLVPDDIAAQAIGGKRLRLVSYIIPDPQTGWRRASREEMIRDLNQYWRADYAPSGHPVARPIAFRLPGAGS